MRDRIILTQRPTNNRRRTMMSYCLVPDSVEYARSLACYWHGLDRVSVNGRFRTISSYVTMSPRPDITKRDTGLREDIAHGRFSHRWISQRLNFGSWFNTRGHSSSPFSSFRTTALIHETLINSTSRAHTFRPSGFIRLWTRRRDRSNWTFVHEQFIFHDLHFHYRFESFFVSLFLSI